MRFLLSHLLRIRREWIPYLILIVSLLVTFGATYYYIQSSARVDRLMFLNMVVHSRDTILDQLNTYTTLARSGAGLFAAHDTIDHNEFFAYVNRIRVSKNYPDILGIGYIQQISKDDLPTVTQQIRNNENPTFRMYPETQHSEYYPVIYFEPLVDNNKNVIGYDMSSDPARKVTMDKARDTGQSTLTGKISLIQREKEGNHIGFIIYAPVYKGGIIPTSLEERRNSLQGYVYIPFHADKFFQKIIKNQETSPFQYKVYAGKETSDKNLIYSSDKTESSAKVLLNNNLTKTSTIDFGGNTLTITFTATDTFAQTADTNLLLLLLGSGIAGSIFLFYISRLQHIARIKAEDSEHNLRDSQERYRRLVASTKVVPWEADFHSEGFTYVGHQAKNLLGYPLKKWYEASFWEQHIHPDDREQILTMSNTLIKKKSEYELHYRMIRKNGKIVWVHDIINVVQTPKGKKVLSGIIIDVSEREVLIKQKDDFISIATHELKTPVTSIKAYAQVLHRQFKKEGKLVSANYVSKMIIQLEKLISLIGDLLDVTKIEGGRLQFHEEKFDSNELIAEIIEEVQRTTDLHKIEAKLQKSPMLSGDRDRVGQVLTNFLTNAIKYSPNSNKILVRTKINDSRLICSVRDYGIGIPPENHGKIFERFFRVKGPNEDAFPGLGLGLYVSAEIIKRHKGKIWVESIQGKGSIFYFSLPIIKQKKTSR